MGKQTWSDGRQYFGQFSKDLKEGYGHYHWLDGRKYQGWWHRDKQHGLGIYNAQDGELKYGIWQMGKKLKWFERNDIEMIKSRVLQYITLFAPMSSKDKEDGDLNED